MGVMLTALAYQEVGNAFSTDEAKKSAAYFSASSCWPAVALITAWCLPRLDGEKLVCDKATKAQLLLEQEEFDWITQTASKWLTQQRQQDEQKKT
jgi:hypothetical protein